MRKKIAFAIEKIPFFNNSPTEHLIFLEIVIGLFLSFSSLYIFAEIAQNVLGKETLAFDTIISHAIYSLRNPVLTDVMFGISFLGADFILFTATILTIILAWKRYKREAILFVSLLCMGVILNAVLKILFQRPRPDLAPLLDLSSSYSFPSGHAMNAFIFYSILAYFVFHFTRSKKLSSIISLISVFIICLIGLSRVYLGVHYPSDVLAGFIVGFFVFVTAIVLERTLALRKLTKMRKNK